ncbi:class I adenylate-forming enzyme family protein [Pseudonocardia endophytica]|uniref:Long-chain acyl-CoA synthetase n=1 Tax=Pseudonocardia endophytica TaxID=401976 RepID=A0A4R1HYA9_PSEEN|nr:AMP-binding protein [Pseudonocardia endophytica]TCK27388.1 long-chain acyl-CoA synthetase [Pseudonocardia endophytica]
MTAAHPPVLRDAPALPDGLLSRIHGAAAALRERGAGPGSRVAIGPCIPDDTVAWLLGADVLGAAALVVAPSWTSRERDAVLSDAEPDVCVDGAPHPSSTSIDPHPGDDVLFYLATTSGSSGRPKVLARTRRSWRIGFDALGPLPGPVLLPGSPASSLFLFGALHALYHGADVRWRPSLDAADLAGVGTVHLVPAQLSALLAAPLVGPRVIVSGGAAVGAGLRARRARLLPDTELVEYYGAAETSLMALRRDDGPLRALPGVDIRVRDDELEIRTPQAFAGHLRSGRLEPAGDGFLRLGDRGSLTDSGDLVVHGRGSATISQGGMLIAAEEVEDVLRDVPGVSDVVVSGTPHPRLGELVTAVVEAPSDPPALSLLRTAARDGLAAAKRPRRWLVTTALPRLTSGKVARSRVATGLADGTLDAAPLPSEAPAGTAAEPGTTGESVPNPMIDGSARIDAAGDTDPRRTADHGVRSPAESDTTDVATLKIDGSVRMGATDGTDPRPTADHGRGGA